MSCPHGNHPDGCERCAEIADHERAYELLFKENATLRAEVERLAAQAAPTEEKRCACNDRLASGCPGEWEPGCDLGNNPKYVRVGQSLAQAPVVQAGEYPPRPFDNHFDQAFRPDAAQAVRMLTDDEQTAIIDMHSTGRAQGDHECAEAIQRKFCAVNGLRIPADGKIGGAA